jgi:hypothetical protein
MLGTAGFRLFGAAEIDGELELDVETAAELVGCTGCGVRATSHGRRMALVRDLSMSGRPTRLRWNKRLWRCHEPLCDRQTWTEASEHVRARVADRTSEDRDLCRGRRGQPQRRSGRPRLRRGLGDHDERGSRTWRAAGR